MSESAGVDAPLWLIGTGRCGSSLLLRLLSYHPELAWQSHYTSRLRGGPAWAGLARLHDLPGMTGLLPRVDDRKWVPQATESYRLLEAATQGRFTAPQELQATDLDAASRSRLRAMVSQHLAAQGKQHFLMKHTGFPRVDYLLEAFPKARFVHVVRDGRAVAVSLCKVDWWSGEAQWGWGPIEDADLDVYVRSGCHELVLAALYWKVLMAHYAPLAERLAPERFLQVRYDVLVADPVGTLRGIADWAGLGTSDVFERRVRATPMMSDDRRWRRSVTDDESRLLTAVLAEPLTRWGFGA